MQAATLTPGEVADDLLLVTPLEVEAADVGTALHFELAHGEDIGTVRNRCEHRLGVVQALTGLVHRCDLHCRADHDFA